MRVTNPAGVTEEFFVYYPAHNKLFPRRTLIGLLDGNLIHVAQAICYTGTKARFVRIPETEVYIRIPGKPADNFSKVEGRRRALDKARGGFFHDNSTYIPTKRQTILTVDATGSPNPGKLFVQEVEKWLANRGFPTKQPKIKKPKVS